MGRGFKKQLTATVDPITHDQVEYTRKQRGYSQSRYVAEAVDLQLRVDGEEVLAFASDGIENARISAEENCRIQGIDFNPKKYWVMPDALWQQERIALDNCILARDHYGAVLENAVHDLLIANKGLIKILESLIGTNETVKTLRRKTAEWEEGRWWTVPGIPEGPTTFAVSRDPRDPPVHPNPAARS